MNPNDRNFAASTPSLLDPRVLLSGMRWMQAALGLLCFGLGAVGAVVPGMPTTVFLLMGSYFLTRSCPALERTLREHRLFAPYAMYLDETTPFPPRARRAALIAMWTSISISTALLAWRGVNSIVLGSVIAAGVVGTVSILRFRRHLDRKP